MVMHNYRSLLLLFICFFSFISIGAMESVIDFNSCPTNDRIISMQDCWAQDYANNINEVRNIDFNGIVSRLDNEQYLPKNANSLEHLLYLSTVQRGDTIKTPFSQKQQHKFNTACSTRKKVYAFFVVNGVIISLTALFGYPNFVALAQCSQSNQTDCVSQASALAIPATVTFAGALLVGFTSLYATGILPDASARKADKVQDKIRDLGSKYLTLAKYWIDIYFMYPDKAIDIAQCFDMEALKASIKLNTHNAKSGGMLINPLKEAWHFIMNKHIL
ncbi:MAG TPA: hypothetical protein VJ201_07495, partial [Candidatus Babeliales bacterium]|nr:hypothetical protein [Candidatus Babeliales bacterium]